MVPCAAGPLGLPERPRPGGVGPPLASTRSSRRGLPRSRRPRQEHVRMELSKTGSARVRQQSLNPFGGIPRDTGERMTEPRGVVLLDAPSNLELRPPAPGCFFVLFGGNPPGRVFTAQREGPGGSENASAGFRPRLGRVHVGSASGHGTRLAQA